MLDADVTTKKQTEKTKIFRRYSFVKSRRKSFGHASKFEYGLSLRVELQGAIQHVSCVRVIGGSFLRSTRTIHELHETR